MDIPKEIKNIKKDIEELQTKFEKMLYNEDIKKLKEYREKLGSDDSILVYNGDYEEVIDPITNVKNYLKKEKAQEELYKSFKEAEEEGIKKIVNKWLETIERENQEELSNTPKPFGCFMGNCKKLYDKDDPCKDYEARAGKWGKCKEFEPMETQQEEPVSNKEQEVITYQDGTTVSFNYLTGESKEIAIPTPEVVVNEDLPIDKYENPGEKYLIKYCRNDIEKELMKQREEFLADLVQEEVKQTQLDEDLLRTTFNMIKEGKMNQQLLGEITTKLIVAIQEVKLEHQYQLKKWRGKIQ